MFNENGSLVESRKNPMVYTLIFAILTIFVILAIIGMVLKKIRDIRSSKAWQDSNKTKPTTKENINAVSQKAGLTGEEKHILETLCKKFKPTNLEYLIRDLQAIKALFKQQYDDYIASNASQEKLEKFFELLYKLEKAHDTIMTISSVKSIPTGQRFIYLDTDRNQWSLTLDRCDQQGIVLEISKIFFENAKKPEPLSKCVLTFKTEAGTLYTLLTRVVRYEEEKQGKYVLIASTNSTLTSAQRRETKRKHIETECSFSAVKVIKDDKVPSYEILERKYNGKLQNISTGGCRFICPMPIKQGQHLCIEMSLAEDKLQAIGLIINTTKSTDGKYYVLHVKFIDIDIEVKNKISAFIYEY